MTMGLGDRIQEHVERLPVSLQAEVLDFVEYLMSKAESSDECKAWTDLSLSHAMRCMEEEETPTYTMADLRILFS
jgi:hypothetical protein